MTTPRCSGTGSVARRHLFTRLWIPSHSSLGYVQSSPDRVKCARLEYLDLGGQYSLSLSPVHWLGHIALQIDLQGLRPLLLKSVIGKGELGLHGGVE